MKFHLFFSICMATFFFAYSKEEVIISENIALKASSGNSVGNLLNTSANFLPRSFHTVTVFKDKLLLMGVLEKESMVIGCFTMMFG